jgi:hypothetical protein
MRDRLLSVARSMQILGQPTLPTARGWIMPVQEARVRRDRARSRSSRSWTRSPWLLLTLSLAMSASLAPVAATAAKASSRPGGSTMVAKAVGPESSVYFKDKGIRCSLSLAPLDQVWDGHRTVLAEGDGRAHCFVNSAGSGYRDYPVNRIRIVTRLVVEDIDGQREVACGPIENIRRNRASLKARCVGQALLPYDCKWHAYSTAWITLDGVRKKTWVDRHRWVLAGKRRCT